MPDDLAENLLRTSNELRVQSSALSVKGTEETALRERLAGNRAVAFRHAAGHWR
jgi:hypothetical protein